MQPKPLASVMALQAFQNDGGKGVFRDMLSKHTEQPFCFSPPSVCAGKRKTGNIPLCAKLQRAFALGWLLHETKQACCTKEKALANGVHHQWDGYFPAYGYLYGNQVPVAMRKSSLCVLFDKCIGAVNDPVMYLKCSWSAAVLKFRGWDWWD